MLKSLQQLFLGSLLGTHRLAIGQFFPCPRKTPWIPWSPCYFEFKFAKKYYYGILLILHSKNVKYMISSCFKLNKTAKNEYFFTMFTFNKLASATSTFRWKPAQGGTAEQLEHLRQLAASQNWWLCSVLWSVTRYRVTLVVKAINIRDLKQGRPRQWKRRSKKLIWVVSNLIESIWTGSICINAGDFSWSWILKDFIQVQKEEENSSAYVHVLHKTSN